MKEALFFEVSSGVATITIDRPERKNAISLNMWKGLAELAGDISGDKSIRCVIVTGAGDAFSAGADITEFRSLRSTPEMAREYNSATSDAEEALANIPVPTVALVSGVCYGGACSIALACDFRFCDSRATFAITPGKLGVVYGYMSTKRLVEAVGVSTAKWMLFSGATLDATTACTAGLVDRVVDPRELATVGEEATRAMAKCARTSVRGAKRMVELVVGRPDGEPPEAAEIRHASFAGPDYREGVAAFLEKRTPKFADM